MDIYVRLSFYHETHDIAEVFVGIGKNGTTLQGMLDGWAIQTSIALQYGVPLSVIVNKFKGQSFQPAGNVDGLGLKQCSSLYDLIVRIMELESGTAAP
jgi:ribonucleoside-diphosphate reductase alpha chain